MPVRIAINGFGRIGRLTLRAIYESGRRDIEILAVNDLAPVATHAHLLRHDSSHGRFPAPVRVFKNALGIGADRVVVLTKRDPGSLPWSRLGVDVVLECTGLFADRTKAAVHLAAGAKRVLISAPATGADLTVVYGVNDKKLRKHHRVVSNASCTTNCLAPVASVLHKHVGIAQGFMTTVHAYTADQRIVDTLHGDLRRARSAASSMIPTSTGAARAVGLVLPELSGKLDGTAIRVPTANVSLIDFTFMAKRKTSVEEINGAFKRAARSRLRGILATSDEPLVSVDFNHDPASSTVDLGETQVIEGRFARVLSWYDNEWGFANRMADTAVAMGKLG